jgi:hypothetical protein
VLIRGKVFPIPAMTRDVGDYGDLLNRLTD